MNDYIRKAVALADGFGWRGEVYIGHTDDPRTMVNAPCGISMLVNEPMMLDALAAQLVRQVDAIGGYVGLWYTDAYIKVVRFVDDGGLPFPTCKTLSQEPWHYGDDRTMNTIKAIVDSGVLTCGPDGQGVAT